MPKMKICPICGRKHHAGFISTRFEGTDGVSLETEKWAQIFEKEDITCFYFAGELDRPAGQSYLVPEAHFSHPEIRMIYDNCFGVLHRERHITQKIYEIKRKLKDHLYQFIDKFDIDFLVPQNALTIPLNIPLGMAITEVISETGIPVIAHHHDFFWERKHFTTNAVWEYLNMAFPPHLPSIRHVVINSSQDNQLSLRTGISGTIIPNVMDFESPPPMPDDYSADIRDALGVAEDETLVLQPTRIVKRKGIEHAIELVRRLGKKAKLVISHASGDEGYGYARRLRNYSELMNVHTVFAADIIGDKRGRTPNGQKIYTLADIYHYADLITYPSNIEGFGNAFLEAIYFCKPIVVNNYSIYATDIKPKGFDVIEIDGYVNEEAMHLTREVLQDSELREKMTKHNYETAQKFFSYAVLEQKLKTILADCLGCRYVTVTK
jgi:glycosyltransferase involved in cell wall biosynthesis